MKDIKPIAINASMENNATVVWIVAGKVYVNTNRDDTDASHVKARRSVVIRRGSKDVHRVILTDISFL
jgi:hypothetical protein